LSRGNLIGEILAVTAVLASILEGVRMEEAVRVLHATFIPVAPNPRLTANPAA
jgi:hypothetical protein